MTFSDHLLNLFALPHFNGHIQFGKQPICATDRKLLAKRLHDTVNRIFVPRATFDVSDNMAKAGANWLNVTGL
jgi:hypothetical protein